MMREQIIAVLHDQDGFVFVGYGSDPDEAYTDMIAAHESEDIDLHRVIFYKYMPIRARITFQ